MFRVEGGQGAAADRRLGRRVGVRAQSRADGGSKRHFEDASRINKQEVRNRILSQTEGGDHDRIKWMEGP